MEKDQLNGISKIILIGGSAGSLDVLLEVLPKLNPLQSVSVIIVLHRRNSDDYILEELLRVKSGLTVVEVEDKTQLLPGRLYVAPSDYHILFEESLSISLDVSEKIHYSRPSIDVAFESAALAFGVTVVGILLSGANSDGTDGLIAIKKYGGITAIQSPETADVPYMPQFAKDHAVVDHIFSPSEIIGFVNSFKM